MKDSQTQARPAPKKKWTDKYKSVGINKDVFEIAEEMVDRAWPAAMASTTNSKILMLIYHAMDDLEQNERENIPFPTRAKVRIGN